MEKGCEQINRQGKDLQNSRKLRKVVVSYKNKQTSSFLKVYVLENLEDRKKYLIQKVPDVISITN